MIVGIDPGANGGIAIIKYETTKHYYDNNQYVETNAVTDVAVFPYADDTLKYILNIYNEKIKKIYIEDVHAMPGQGVVSMFNFGMNVGIIHGMIKYSGVECKTVTPQKWKKYFGLIKKDKKASIETAKSIFTGVNLLKTNRSRKEHDGMAEALLIARYGYDMEIMKNEN